MLRLYNTLSRSIENFTPINPPYVGIYSCGPTVYDYQHIGHMRRYVGDDILIRVLQLNKYDVKHVMNITDVGHLVSDADEGEDKMEKGARKHGLSVWDIAKKFEQQFIESAEALGIRLPKNLMHATDYIKEQIELIQILEKKGYTYRLADGIYYDTSKFPHYFQLSRQNPEELKAGARVEFVSGKRNITDFALWKFSYPEGLRKDEYRKTPIDTDAAAKQRQMEWESPWGIGFPGWHIECSAMSMKALGPTLDIHTGGIDHIMIHHTNEIAQSEAATDKTFVNYWVHHNHLMVNGEKMSKSLGNFYTVQDIVDREFDPMALRYLYLQTHYRQEMNFTWESLEAAETALHRLRSEVNTVLHHARLNWQSDDTLLKNDENKAGFYKEFLHAVNDDLNIAKGLAIVRELLKSDYSAEEKAAVLRQMDKVLGLDILKRDRFVIPAAVKKLIKEREEIRKSGDFKRSDELREKIRELGFAIKDTKTGTEIEKI